MYIVGSTASDGWWIVPLAFLCLFGAVAGLFARSRIRRHKTALFAWAGEHGMEILECRYRFFFCGPFTFRRLSTDTTYGIRARNKRGQEWTGYARIGGLFRTRVKVVFDH